MTTIITIFVLSLTLSLIITPLVGRLAVNFGIVDIPSERKIHTKPIPRAGGIAIYLSFFLSFVPVVIPQVLSQSKLLIEVITEYRLVYIAIGSCVIFALGILDDIKGIGYRVKFLSQILAAMIAYFGGIKIQAFGLPGMEALHFAWYLSLPITVFWVLLVVNAINLIDGLDGLAAGVGFFACVVLMVLCVVAENYLTAFLLAALGGSILGFLRYNFNPASIFMGDSGSYFIGYMLATLSIIGSIKSHAALTIVLPMIALGLPLMDTIWAPIRRFMLGQRLFSPDKEHFHHRLLNLGLSHRTAGLTLYGVTAGAGIISILMVHARDERAAFLFILIGAVVIFGIRKLGYMSYAGAGMFIRWAGDLSEELGIRRDRRKFLAHQIAISETNTINAFWTQVIAAGKFLENDYMELRVGGQIESLGQEIIFWHGNEKTRKRASLHSPNRLYMRFPLVKKGQHLGVFVLSKDLSTSSQPTTAALRRIEHLRRTMASTLFEIINKRQPAMKKKELTTGIAKVGTKF